jgi:hypothetical protein
MESPIKGQRTDGHSGAKSEMGEGALREKDWDRGSSMKLRNFRLVAFIVIMIENDAWMNKVSEGDCCEWYPMSRGYDKKWEVHVFSYRNQAIEFLNAVKMLGQLEKIP